MSLFYSNPQGRWRVFLQFCASLLTSWLTGIVYNWRIFSGNYCGVSPPPPIFGAFFKCHFFLCMILLFLGHINVFNVRHVKPPGLSMIWFGRSISKLCIIQLKKCHIVVFVEQYILCDISPPHCGSKNYLSPFILLREAMTQKGPGFDPSKIEFLYSHGNLKEQ